MSDHLIATEAVPSSVLHASLAIEPPKIVRAEGHFLYTSDGRSIFDASGGAAVSCIGHGHPRVKRAIKEQLDKVEYCFAPHFTTDTYERLASFLVHSTDGHLSKVFVSGSGSEAVEACLKMARQYHVERQQPQRTRFIVRDRSYHGNTIGSLGVSGHRARRAIFEPMLGNNSSFISPFYPYRDQKANESSTEYVARLAEELDGEFQRVGADTVCGVILETMAGLTLGAVPPGPGYLKAMKEVCERHGALFILDEVLAGMGRTGTLHAWQQEDVTPDLQTIAKGLGAGYASIGALLVGQKVVDVLSRGSKAFVHFQTYHGHPVACAAAYEVQQVIQDENLIKNCREMGEYLGERLQYRLTRHPHVGDIRGRGLAWALELVEHKASKKPFAISRKVAPSIHAAGLEKFGIALLPGGGVVDGVQGDLIVVTPSYTVSTQDVDTIVDRVCQALEYILGSSDTASRI